MAENNMVVRVDKPYQMLIADDDAGFRASLRDVFEARQTVCTWEAESGEEAMELAESRRTDIVLLDMHMHRLTGLETLRVLKSMNEQLPCILITASISDELRRDATDAGAYSVLGKPVTKKELVTTVSLALIETYYDEQDTDVDPLL